MHHFRNNKDQVFISFRGQDKRHGFLSHLRQKLLDGNVNVFTDSELTGQPLNNLFRHIRNSKIVIVIFSENYGDSQWCMEELVEIRDCLKTEKIYDVIPIFHIVEISCVKEVSGKFGEGIESLQKWLRDVKGVKDDEIESRTIEWKKALDVVTKMAGLYYDGESSEAAFTEEIVEKVNGTLAKIAHEEKLNMLSKTLSQGKDQAKQPTVNIYNFNVSYNYYSMTVEAANPEGYPMNPDLKHMSFGHRRTNSDLDNTDQYRPFPFEKKMVEKHGKNHYENNNNNIVTIPSSIVPNHAEYYRSNDNFIDHDPYPQVEKMMAGRQVKNHHGNIDNNIVTVPSSIVQNHAKNYRSNGDIIFHDPLKGYTIGRRSNGGYWRTYLACLRSCFGCVDKDDEVVRMIQSNGRYRQYLAESN